MPQLFLCMYIIQCWNRVTSQLNHKIQKNVTIYKTACFISTPKIMSSLYFSKSKIFYCCNQSADSIPALMIMLHSLQSDMFAPFKDYNLKCLFLQRCFTQSAIKNKRIKKAKDDNDWIKCNWYLKTENCTFALCRQRQHALLSS